MLTYKLTTITRSRCILRITDYITRLYVTRYGKTDHSRFFMKIAFWVWIDAEFTVEFNGQRARL